MRRARFLFWLDITLLLLFALLEEPVTTGLFGHEWISIGFAGLLFLHLLANWRWIAAALGRYRIAARRARINTWLNGTLFVTMVRAVVRDRGRVGPGAGEREWGRAVEVSGLRGAPR